MSPNNYTFHRQPRDYQLASFERARDAEFWLHNWDPRTGKTKIILDTFEYSYGLGRVNALVVIAYPADVHLIWRDEAPKDLSPEFYARTRLLVWRSGKMKTRQAQEDLAALLMHEGPAILTLNCEAILTETAWGYLRKFFAKHRVMLVVDEDWATRWSARTKRLLAMGRGKTTLMRRLISGTPADEGPENLYFPTTFLKPGCLGFTSPLAFRNRYVSYEQEEVAPGVLVRKRGYNRRTGTEFDIPNGYQNLDELHERLAEFSDRVRREGSNKVYAPRYFTMTDKQRRVYDQLRDEYTAELSTGPVPVAHVLTRMTRLQAIARNFYPPERVGRPCTACACTGYMEGGDECEKCGGLGALVDWTKLERIDDRNPAADALVEELRLSRRPFLIWCRFVQDVEDALAVARTIYPRTARYDRTVARAEREESYHRFRAGELDGIVATECSGLSRGHDCSRAKLVVYYSNEWGLRNRRQSEDRGESMDRTEWTDIVDLIATDTRDLDVITSLRDKRSIAEQIVGDPVTNWI